MKVRYLNVLINNKPFFFLNIRIILYANLLGLIKLYLHKIMCLNQEILIGLFLFKILFYIGVEQTQCKKNI